MSCGGRIAAIREVPKQEGGYKLGDLVQLEAGTALEICGEGYNDRTIRVRSQAETFFVFRQDLEQELGE